MSTIRNSKKTRDTVINRLNGAYERNWAGEGIDLVRGRARFVEPKVIEIQQEDCTVARYTAPHILIATGSHPNLPEVSGVEHGITSDGFFELEELPHSIAVIGAGYIAVELAGVLNAVNVQTHMFIRGERFLRKFDPMIQKTMTDRYEAAGVHLHRHHSGFKEIQLVCNGKGKDRLIKLIDNDGSELEVNELLWAIGRAPEVEDLDLDIPGVKLNASGHVAVDEYQNTSIEGIYALGDVTGQAELTPGRFNMPSCIESITDPLYQSPLPPVAALAAAFLALSSTNVPRSHTRISPPSFSLIQRSALSGSVSPKHTSATTMVKLKFTTPSSPQCTTMSA